MSTLQDEGIAPVAQTDDAPLPQNTAREIPENLNSPRAISVAGPIPNPPATSATLADEGITPVGEDAQPAFVPPIVQASVLKDGVMNHLKSEDPDAAFDDAVNINMGDLKWPLMAFKGVNPDVAAQVDKLAKANGLTYPQAEDGKEDLGVLQQARDIYSSLSATDQNGKFIYPNTIKWLQDPVNLAKSKDDVAGLTAIEDAVRSQNQIGESSAMQTARGAASGIEKAAGSVLSLPAAATDFVRGVFSPMTREGNAFLQKGPIDQPVFTTRNVTPDPADVPLADLPDWLSSVFGATRFVNKHATANDGATLQGRTVLGDAQKGDYLGAAQMAAVGIAPVIPVVAGSFVDPAVGLSYVGGTSGGSTYQNDIEAGKSPDKAATDALLTGEINTLGQGAFGSVGQFERMQKLFATPASRQSATALVGNLIRQTTLSAAQGGLTQGASQVADDAADYATGNKDAFKGEVTKAANAMIIGSLQDGLLAAPAGALEGLHQLSAQAEGASAWQKLTGTVGASKLTQRDPDAMAQFVTDNLTAAGKPTTVGIDADKITTFFQSDNQGFNKFVSDMGLKPQEVANAATTGSEIALPIGPYQAKYAGTPLDAAINQDIRFTPGGLSQNEVEQQTAQVKQMQESIKAELAKTTAGEASQLPSHIVTMRDTLMRDKADGGMGYTADQADSQIAVLMAGLHRIAANRGESVEDTVNRLGLSLKVGDIAPDANDNLLVKNQERADTYGNGQGNQSGSKQNASRKVPGVGVRERRPSDDARPQIRVEAHAAEPTVAASAETRKLAADLVESGKLRDALQAERYTRYNPYGDWYPVGLEHSDENGEKTILERDNPESWARVPHHLKDAAERYVQLGRDHAAAVERHKATDKTGALYLPDTLPQPLHDLREYRTLWLKHEGLPERGLDEKVYSDIGGQKFMTNEQDWTTDKDYIAHANVARMKGADGKDRLVVWEAQPSYRFAQAGSQKREALEPKYAPANMARHEVLERLAHEVRKYADARGLKVVLGDARTVQDIYGRRGNVTKTFNNDYGSDGYVTRAFKRVFSTEGKTLAKTELPEKLWLPHHDESERHGFSGYEFDPAGAKIARDQQTKTPEFTRWFGDSKVVDAQGQPKVMFHGTPKGTFDSFDTYGSNHGLYGQGSYFTDDQKIAEGYAYKGKPKEGEKPALYPVYLSIKHPMDMDAKADIAKWEQSSAYKTYGSGFRDGMTNAEAYKSLEQDIADDGYVPHDEAAQTLQDAIISQGYDGLTHEGGGKHAASDGTKHRVYVAFDPEQIKSAIGNIGTFDPKNPNIRYQDERGAITFQNGKTVIHLLKNADLSTFVHETGHLFLHEMQGLVEQGKASDAVKADLQTLLDYAGVKPGENLTIDQEEKVVKSFEAYLREGKAPDVGLSGAFARFRTWLTNIYRSATALGVEPTDEVRQVFDRMLASEDDIAHAQEYYSRKGDVLDLIHATEEEKAIARNKLVKVQQSEYEKQARAYMKSYLQAVGGMSAIRDSAKAAVDAHPVYQALEAAKAGKIDEADLRQAIGAKGLKEFNEKFPGLVKEDGEHSLATLAAEHGFQSPETLADNLLSAVPKAEAIKNYTMRLVQEKDQQIRDEITKRGATPADHVMHSEGSLAYLIAETNLMAKQVKGTAPRLIAATYREAARQAIGDMKVQKAVRFSDFARTEARLGKQVLSLAKAGKWDEALEARKKQMAQHAMVQAAIEARDERTEILRRFSPSKLESKIKSLDNEYIDPVRQILSTYGLSDIAPKAPYDLAHLADVDTVLFSQLPTWLVQGRFAGRTNDLTMDQLRAVNDAARSVLGFGNDLRKSNLALEEKTIGEIVEKSVGNINALPDRNVRQLDGSFIGNAITRGLQSIDWTKSHLTKAQFLFKRLDNFSEERQSTVGILGKMFHAMREGEHNQSEAQRAVYELAKPHLAVLRDAATRLRKENGDYFSVPGVEKPEVYQTKGRANWSPEELIAYMMNTGAEGNISALKNSFGHDTPQFDKVAQQFSAKELHAIEGVRDSIGSLYDGLNETNFKIYNRHVEKVDAVPQDFTDKDGVPVHMKGGYWPLMFDYEMNRLQGKYSEEDALKGQISAFMRSAKPEDGMTKSRVIGHALAPRLDMGVFGDHVDDTTRFIHLAPIVRDLDRVMQNGAWRDAVVAKVGVNEYKQARDWLKQQANPGRKQTTDFMRGADKIANYARETATASALGFNFVAGLKWRTSALNSAVALGGWRHIFNGYAALGTKGLGTSTLGLSNSKTWHEMESKSMLLKTRELKGIRDIRDDVEKLQWNPRELKIPGTDKTFTTADLKNAMYWWAKANDRAIVAPVWMGGYLKYKNEMGDFNMSEADRVKEAIHYADSIISSSQPTSLNVDMNSIQRNQSAYAKIFSIFMSYPYTIANRFMYQAEALSAGAITKTEYTNHILQEVLLEPLARVGITAAFLASVPTAATMALAPMNNLLDGLPGLGLLANYVESGFDTNELSPVFDVGRKAKNVVHDVITGKDITQLAWDVARLTSYLTKAPPVLNIVKTLLDFNAEAQGEKNTYK